MEQVLGYLETYGDEACSAGKATDAFHRAAFGPDRATLNGCRRLVQLLLRGVEPTPQRRWQTHALPPGVRSEVVRIIQARASLAVAYLDLHAGMKQLVSLVSAVGGCRHLRSAEQLPDTQLRMLARDAAAAAELPTRDQDALVAILWKVESVAKQIELLAQGSLEIQQESSGAITLQLEHLGRRRRSKPAEVQREALDVLALAASAFTALQAACSKVKAAAGAAKPNPAIQPHGLFL